MAGLLRNMSAIGALEESGGGGGTDMLVVNVALSGEEYLPDHTRTEVLEALQNGTTVFCTYSGAVSMFMKDDDYPEIYTNLLFTGVASSPHTIALHYCYFEYAEDGTFTANFADANV